MSQDQSHETFEKSPQSGVPLDVQHAYSKQYPLSENTSTKSLHQSDSRIVAQDPEKLLQVHEFSGSYNRMYSDYYRDDQGKIHFMYQAGITYSTTKHPEHPGMIIGVTVHGEHANQDYGYKLSLRKISDPTIKNPEKTTELTLMMRKDQTLETNYEIDGKLLNIKYSGTNILSPKTVDLLLQQGTAQNESSNNNFNLVLNRQTGIITMKVSDTSDMVLNTVTLPTNLSEENLSAMLFQWDTLKDPVNASPELDRSWLSPNWREVGISWT